jgi:hypothetical protein
MNDVLHQILGRLYRKAACPLSAGGVTTWLIPGTLVTWQLRTAGPMQDESAASRWRWVTCTRYTIGQDARLLGPRHASGSCRVRSRHSRHHEEWTQLRPPADLQQRQSRLTIDNHTLTAHFVGRASRRCRAEPNNCSLKETSQGPRTPNPVQQGGGSSSIHAYPTARLFTANWPAEASPRRRCWPQMGRCAVDP